MRTEEEIRAAIETVTKVIKRNPPFSMPSLGAMAQLGALEWVLGIHVMAGGHFADLLKSLEEEI